MRKSASGLSTSKFSNSSWAEGKRDLAPPAAITNTRTMLECSTLEQVKQDIKWIKQDGE